MKRYVIEGESLASACRVCRVGRQAALDYLYPEGASGIDPWWWAPNLSSVEKHQRDTVEECVRRNAKRSAARPSTDAWGYTERTPAALSRKNGDHTPLLSTRP